MDRRKLLKAGALLGAAGAAGAAEAQGAPPPATMQAGGPGAARYAAAARAIAAEAERHRRDNALPGLTLVAVDADGWTMTLDAGFDDAAAGARLAPGRLFQIGSISKSVTALAVWRLAEAGRLSLEQDARPLLPGAPWPEPAISVRQLLEHSSGLPDDAPRLPRGGPPGAEGRLWTGFQPGSRWSYSNTGYDLLGMIVERLHGDARLGAVLESEVLRPMGLPTAAGAILSGDRERYAAGHAPFHLDRPYPTRGRLAPGPWVDVTFGAGCVAAPSREMAAYLRWLVGAANGQGRGVLSDAGAAAFCRPTIDAPGWNGGGKYGNGLATVVRGGRSLLHHTGGMVTFNSSFHVDSQARVGCFASTNVGMIDYRPRALTAFACAALAAAREGKPPPEPVREPAPAVSASLPGGYQAADGSGFELVSGPGGLRLRSQGSEAAVEAAGEGQWLSHHPAFDRYALLAKVEGGRTTGLWYGPRFFAAPGAPQPGSPRPEWAALAGRYDNDDPWVGGPKRIVARADGLWLDGTTRLEPLPDGSWRPADEPSSPERLRFDAPFDGRPQRLTFSGKDLLRVAEPG